ncbi:MAG: type II toxin-antitoxin system HigB family toxin [Isosphaeraceae bacterium]
MRVISKNPNFPDFWSKHADAEKPLSAWHQEATHSNWENFADVKNSSASASQVGRYTVFNIGGNKYRLITHIRFDLGIVFVRAVLTHKEYDAGDWKDG